jgi:hypothetical protein
MTSEDIQSQILNDLDNKGEIANSLEYKVNGASMDQQVLLGVLKRLSMYDVRTRGKLNADGGIYTT